MLAADPSPSMIVFRKPMLSIGQIWFHDGATPSRAGVDVIEFVQSLRPVPSAAVEAFTTLTIRLDAPEPELLGAIKKKTRYEIRRAEKEELVYECSDEPGDALLSEFQSFYDEFARLKGRSALYAGALRRYATARRLSLSRVRDKDGSVLTWHSYLRAGERVRLLHSASLFRASHDTAHHALVGRANRFLHFRDMQHFKSRGYGVYDLGGVYTGGTDRERLSINAFKEEFGGRPETHYNCRWGASLKGKAYVLLRPTAVWLLEHLHTHKPEARTDAAPQSP